jgi:hypothetical protein
MGSFIEFNDTLQLTSEQGFPEELDLRRHLKRAYKTEDFKDKIFSFREKPDMRIFHPLPTRCFLVHNIDGKWLYWGHCMVIEQTIDALTRMTSGKFRITKIYSIEHQRSMCRNEVPEGKEFTY